MSAVMNSLEGDVAIVTGARRGIGRAIALCFAEAGASVCVSDLVMEDGILEAVAEEIRQVGRRALAQKVDISRKVEVDDMIRKVVDEFGKIDILVNCAGMWIPGQTLVDCDENNWDIVVDTNLKGTFFCCQAVAKEMVKRRLGRIINLASDIAIYPMSGIGAYGIAKAGIIFLTQQLAIELGEYGIRVNAIAPGMVRTDMNIHLRSSPEVEEQLASKMVLGRLGEPVDISKTVLFLACDNSDHITGQTIVANSGGIIPSLF